MLFFKEFQGKNNKKNVTLQVQIPFMIQGFLAKRALSSASGSRKRGSLTVEAAMVLPLFLFFMVILMVPMGVMKEGRRIQTALEAAGEEVSQYAYVLHQLKLGERLETSGMDGFSEEFLDGLTEEGILLYVRKRVEGRVGFERLESASFVRSSVLRDGETIDLVMDYRVKIPFSVFGLSSMPMTARSCRRAWIGREGGSGKRDGQEDELVYIGKASTRYHRQRTCHYLYNDIKQISFKEVEDARNLSGGKYKPCSRCGRFAEENGSVFLMPSGERYHSDRNCSSIMAYVEAVPLSQVRHMGGCSYCSQ
ncbi:TadE/TadG family type IV pilus assembly protein [Lacrimispora brassicae]